MNYYLEAFRKYQVIQGRATREEFWWFFLISFAIFFVPLFVIGFVDVRATEAHTPVYVSIISGILVVYLLASIVPTIAISVRRLHDIGKSGWWYLLTFIPYIGWLIMLILYVLPGQKMDNKYGPNPYDRSDISTYTPVSAAAPAMLETTPALEPMSADESSASMV